MVKGGMKGRDVADHRKELDTNLPNPKINDHWKYAPYTATDVRVKPRGRLSQQALESKLSNLDKVLGHKLPNPRRNRSRKVYSDGNFSSIAKSGGF